MNTIATDTCHGSAPSGRTAIERHQHTIAMSSDVLRLVKDSTVDRSFTTLPLRI
jgi:hypothetical protein